MNELEKANYSPLFPLLVLVICLALSYLMIGPYVSGIKDMNLEILAKNDEITAMEKKIEDLKYLKNKFSESQDLLKFVAVAFPTNKKIEEFLVQATNMAKGASVELVSLKPSNKQSDKGLEIEVDVNGNYESIILFMENLEKNARLVSVKSVNISSARLEGQEGFTDAKITLDLLEVSKAQEGAEASQEATNTSGEE